MSFFFQRKVFNYYSLHVSFLQGGKEKTYLIIYLSHNDNFSEYDILKHKSKEKFFVPKHLLHPPKHREREKKRAKNYFKNYYNHIRKHT